MGDSPKQVLDSLLQTLAESSPEATAKALEGLAPGDAAAVFGEFPADIQGAVLERFTPQAAAAILGQFDADRVHALLKALPTKQQAVVLQHLEEAHRDALLNRLPGDEASRLRVLIQYPPESAGGLMDPQVASLAEDWTARQAIDFLRRSPHESLYYLYVTDRNGRLVGVLTMRSLLLAAPSDPIAPLIQRDVVSIHASMDREDVAAMMRERRLLALPVVDDEDRLLGVVKHDEMLDTVQEEAFEDLQKLVGAGGDESVRSPLKTITARRLPWLMVNLLTAFAGAAVISLFEPLLAKITALAVLLPIVSALGGNGGAQTLAIVMRGLALREIHPRSARWLVLKEALAGSINGLAVALVAAGVVFVWSQNYALALVIGLAMVVNMITAGLAGAAIPLLLKMLGRDPAQSSQIFLTTFTDIVGFGSFLGFAALFSPMIE